MVLPPLVFGAFVLLAAVGMFRDDPEALPSARENQPAPKMSLTELPGKTVFSDADLRDGKVKLVNFWASWCAPCRVEHPNLNALSEQGLPIYGINYKDKPGNALAFLEELGDPYVAVAADADARTGIDWGVYGVPETYVLAGDGTIILRFAGPVTERVLRERIAPALEQANALTPTK